MKNRYYRILGFVMEYSFYGLLFFVPISISLIEIFISFILFSYVCRKVIKPDFRYGISAANIFMVLLLVFGAISLINSGKFIRISLFSLFIKWAKYAAVCFVIQDGMFTNKMINRGVTVFLVSAGLAVISGLSQYFFGFELLWRNKMMPLECGSYAITSFFNHFNDFGSYLVVVLPMVLALLLDNERFGLRTVLLLLLSIGAGTAMVFTFSRGSWVATAVSVMPIILLGRKKFWWLIPIIFIAIAVYHIPEISDRFFSIFTYGGDSDRFRYWTAATNMIKDHPIIGVGIGTFMANFSKYLPCVYIAYAHNCYLQIWAEAGIFSLLSFLCFVGALFYGGIRHLVVSRDFLLVGLLSGIAGFLIHSFFDTNLYSLQLAVLFWVWAGIILRRCRGD